MIAQITATNTDLLQEGMLKCLCSALENLAFCDFISKTTMSDQFPRQFLHCGKKPQ